MRVRDNYKLGIGFEALRQLNRKLMKIIGAFGIISCLLLPKATIPHAGPLIASPYVEISIRGALELILQFLKYQSRGALDLKNFLRYLRSVPHHTVIKKKNYASPHHVVCLSSQVAHSPPWGNRGE